MTFNGPNRALTLSLTPCRLRPQTRRQRQSGTTETTTMRVSVAQNLCENRFPFSVLHTIQHTIVVRVRAQP